LPGDFGGLPVSALDVGSSSGIVRFLQTLHEAQTGNAAVAVYADSEDYQAYEVGFVEFADAHEIVLLCLTPKGEPDGRRILRMDDVMRVDVENSYIKKLELLYQYRDSLFDKDFTDRPKGGKPDLHGLLVQALEDHHVVHLVDGNDYGPSGFVKDVGEDFVVIDRIGPHGEPDGIATLLLSNVSKVHVGRRTEQILSFLHRYNHGLKKLLG
jgi:hypothetical protein